MSLINKNVIVVTFLFILISLISGCTRNGPDGIKTRIKGSFPAFKGKLVTLNEIDIYKALALDTARISDDGSFSFKFKRQGPGIYLIKVDNKNYITLVLDQEKRVEVSSDLPNLRKNYQVEGSPDSELYRDFEMFLEANRQKVDSLSRSYNEYQRSAGFRAKKLELDKSYQEIFNHQRQYAIQFLENHCSSLASLLVINRRFGERKVLTEKEDFSYYMLIDSCLSLKYPDNKHLAEHKKRIEAASEELRQSKMIERRLSIGQKVPDISLENPSGKSVSLHSLMGKPVVLYFWASWDQPSRKTNALLKQLIDKNLKIKPVVYAIGLESYKEPWEDAIRADGLQNWINVTDYMNIYSSAKTLLNIPGDLPYFILLDKSLMIRYKGNDFDALTLEINRFNP